MDSKERERIRKEIFSEPGKDTIQKQPGISGVDNSDINPDLLRMFSKERLGRIMKKEARRYKQSLRKKWDRWFKAVSR